MRLRAGARFRPAWLLVLLLAVARVVAVPTARPAPAPSCFEEQRPAVCEAGGAESSVAFSSAASESWLPAPPGAGLSPEEARPGLSDAGPLRPRVVELPFVLHQRPPPSPPLS